MTIKLNVDKFIDPNKFHSQKLKTEENKSVKAIKEKRWMVGWIVLNKY